jgi:cytochrome c oxidase subunit IV
MNDHITSRRTLLIVDMALLVLALLTVGIAQINLHGWNHVVALGIAVSKAILICLFFMELKFASPLHRLVGLAAIMWLLLLLLGTLDDVLTRAWLPVPGK